MNDSTSFTVGPDGEPDKYRLLRQVGGGGEAEIWQAVVGIAGGDERVAVKILRDVHAVDGEAWQERWSDQVELLRLLRHPGVVGVHEYFAGPRMHHPGEADFDSRHHYLVMNWVDGSDLRQWTGTRPTIDRFETLRYLTQIADVLDWLHSGNATTSGRPVVHGDISPGNIIINSDGQAVIVDFGLFRMARSGPTPPTGTQGYCAPEVLASGEYTAASDRYAFGALAYFLLTGQNPPDRPDRLREQMRDRLADMFGAVDADALVAIVADAPDDRPAAGQWMRTLWPHASTAIPREAPLPPVRPGHSAMPPAPGGGDRPTADPARPSWAKALVRKWGPWGVAVGAVVVLCLIGAAVLTGHAIGSTSAVAKTAIPDPEPLQPGSRSGFTASEDDPGRYVADCSADPWLEFSLNGVYTEVSAEFDMTGESGSDTGSAGYALIGDGKTLATAKGSASGPALLTSDVSGVEVLRVEVSGAESGQCGVSVQDTELVN